MSYFDGVRLSGANLRFWLGRLRGFWRLRIGEVRAWEVDFELVIVGLPAWGDGAEGVPLVRCYRLRWYEGGKDRSRYPLMLYRAS